MAGALEEDGPAASVWAVSLYFGGKGLEGVVSSATYFPLALSPAEDSGTGAERSGAPIEGMDPKRPKSSSAGKKPVNIA